jgi:hypothetical protein
MQEHRWRSFLVRLLICAGIGPKLAHLQPPIAIVPLANLFLSTIMLIKYITIKLNALSDES